MCTVVIYECVQRTKAALDTWKSKTGTGSVPNVDDILSARDSCIYLRCALAMAVKGNGKLDLRLIYILS